MNRLRKYNHKKIIGYYLQGNNQNRVSEKFGVSSSHAGVHNIIKHKAWESK